MAPTRRIILLGFLGLGLLTGLFAGKLSRALAAPTPAQGEVLIVFVDALSQPSLLGIWEVRQAEGGAWAWTPLYPAPLGDETNPYAQPHAPIQLSARQLQDPGSLPPLSGTATWAQVYWLDQAALARLLELSGNQPSAPQPTWSGPQRALREQVQAINALCAGAGQAAYPGSLDVVLALLPRHLRSTVSPFELITAWDAWMGQGAPLACSHPWAQ